MASAAVLAVLVAAALAQAAALDVSKHRKLDVSLYAGPPQNDPLCNGKELSCNGCTTRVTCRTVNRVLVHVSDTACPSSTPYCNGATGSCTADASLVDATCTAPQPVASVQCPTASGYYPDLTDCTKYYICSNWDAFSMDCSVYPNTVYSQRTGTCVPRSSTTCFKLTCSRADQVVAYAPYPNIYALCRDNNANNAILGLCGSEQAVDGSGNCVAACLSAGRFYVSDTTYDECVDLGNNRFSQPIRRTCPGQSQFDRSAQLCLDPTTTGGSGSGTGGSGSGTGGSGSGTGGSGSGTGGSGSGTGGSDSDTPTAP